MAVPFGNRLGDRGFKFAWSPSDLIGCLSEGLEEMITIFGEVRYDGR